MVANKNKKGGKVEQKTKVSDSMQKPMPRTKKKKATRRPKKGNDAAKSMILGCVDPFSDCAVGCKMVSSDTSRTFTYTVRGKISAVTTDANGAAAVWIQPGIEQCLARSFTIVGGIVTAWALPPGDIPEAASIQAIAAKYRVVCAGVHVFANCNTNEAKGTVMVTTSHNSLAVPTPSYNLSSYSYEEVQTDSLFGFDRYYGFRRLSPAQVANFESTTIALPHSGWNGITISITGGTASTALLEVEYVFHIELQPEPISIAARIADPPKEAPPGLDLAISNANKRVPFGDTITGWISTVEDIAASEAVSVAKALWAWV